MAVAQEGMTVDWKATVNVVVPKEMDLWAVEVTQALAALAAWAKAGATQGVVAWEVLTAVGNEDAAA